MFLAGGVIWEKIKMSLILYKKSIFWLQGKFEGSKFCSRPEWDHKRFWVLQNARLVYWKIEKLGMHLKLLDFMFRYIGINFQNNESMKLFKTGIFVPFRSGKEILIFRLWLSWMFYFFFINIFIFKYVYSLIIKWQCFGRT